MSSPFIPFVLLLASTAPGFEASPDLPLVGTRTNVHVSGVLLRGIVRQTYVNRGSKVIEARYVFPGSTGAAIDGLEMTIGERRIVAQIAKKAEARATYEAAKASGKSASLLEQHRPNVFETSVANIQPGDRIDVTVSYTELLVPEERVYEIVLPQVVAERFEPEPWGATPAKRSPAASVDVSIDAGMPIHDVVVPSHDVAAWMDETRASVRIEDRAGFDRDVVVRYRLAGDHVQTGVVMDEHPDGGAFVFMVQPPVRAAANEVTPREYIFVVDVSGSMGGFPLEVSRALLTSLLRGMGPMDRFNVLCFASSSAWLSDTPVRVTEENRLAALDLMHQQSGGGTQLGAALDRALAAGRPDGMSTSIVVITDGFITAERETFETIRDNRGKANVFAFGIGDNVNRHLVEGIATAGLGQPFIVTNERDARAAADRFARYVSSPMLTDITLTLDGFDAYDLEPSSIPDLLADRPVVVLGKYRGEPKGHLRLKGRGGLGPFEASIPLERTGERHPEIPKLWARRRIADLTVMHSFTNDPLIGNEIEQLGLAYSLLTSRTSFVAVDTLRRSPANPIQAANRAPIRETPELDPKAATAAFLLVLGVLVLAFDRRRLSAGPRG